LLYDPTGEHLRARILACPAEDGPIVSIKAHFAADDFHSTAVFPTRDEALDFARVRWGSVPKSRRKRESS
jgi:hypothetical protein